MRAPIREKLDRLRDLYPPERLARSKERIRRLWRGEKPLDRLPFVLIPLDFSYYDDVFEPGEGLDRYLDAFLRRGVADDDYIPAFFTGCRMGAMPSLFGAEEVVLGNDFSCKRLLSDEASVRALPEPYIRENSPAKAWLDAQRYYLEETEGLIPVHVNDMQGPMDVCGQLWGYENVLAAPYEDEELYEFLMGRVTDAFLLLWNEQKRLLGDAFLPTHLYAWDWVPPDNGATLSADSLVMLSPDFFRRWYKGTLQRISDALGGLTVHSCGDFSGVAAALCETRGLRGINASQMSAQQLIDAGAGRDLVYIFQCPFERAHDAVQRSIEGGYPIQPTITGAWPEDYRGTGFHLLKARVRQLHEWFTP
jgi:hypothetical protein